jgi:hypothetical protein
LAHDANRIKEKKGKEKYIPALEPTGAYWTSKKALVGMIAVAEKDLVE